MLKLRDTPKYLAVFSTAAKRPLSEAHEHQNTQSKGLARQLAFEQTGRLGRRVVDNQVVVIERR